MSVMVTGGAGYLGSHMVRQLIEANTVVVAYDNLSKGHREAVRNAPLIEGDIRNSSRLAGAIDKYAVDSVIHFAASSLVQESMEDPQKYYLNNVGGTISREFLAVCPLSASRHLSRSPVSLYDGTTTLTIFEGIVLTSFLNS